MKNKEKLYLRKEDDECCYPLEVLLNEARDEGLDEITLFETVPIKDKEYIWCTELEDAGERSACRKSECTDYKPRGNSKSGVCRYRGILLGPGKEVTFKMKQNESI